MSILLKLLKNKYVLGSLITLITVCIIILFFVNKSEKAQSAIIIAKIEKSSELTTSKITFTGMSEYKDEGIKFINRSDFVMVYEATARIGIDVKEVKVDVNNITKTVWLTIPDAQVLDVKVNMDTIKYFDTSFALLNINYKEDATKATAIAEQEAKEEVESMGVVEMANTQSELLLKGLIQDTVPTGYSIKVKAH